MSFRQLAAAIALFPWALAAVADNAATLEPAPGTEPAATSQAIEAEHKQALASRSASLFSAEMKYKSTIGTPAYYQEAFDMNCLAARDGDTRAYFALGWLYANGRGVKKDLVLASTMLSKAAAAGHAKAREILEVMPEVTEQPALPACLTKPPEPVLAESPIAAEPPPVNFFEENGRIHKLVSRLAPEYGIDVRLAMAVIAVESGFNPRATSPKNAQGLMQLIPDTARRFRVRDAYDPEQNIKGGLAYLEWLMTEFEGKVELVAAAYNAGEKAVARYGGIPPYAETQNYVQKVLSLYRKTTHPYRDHLGRAVSLTAP